MVNTKDSSNNLKNNAFYNIEDCIIWEIDGEFVRPNGYYNGIVGLLVDPEYPGKLKETEWLNSSDVEFKELTYRQQKDVIEKTILMWDAQKESI